MRFGVWLIFPVLQSEDPRLISSLLPKTTCEFPQINLERFVGEESTKGFLADEERAPLMRTLGNQAGRPCACSVHDDSSAVLSPANLAKLMTAAQPIHIVLGPVL